MGGHYNSRKTMDREIRGHRESRKEMLESYENFERQERRMKSEPRLRTNSGVSRLTAGDESHKLRRYKPGAGLGWTEPRMEYFIGMVDRRKFLPGYVGGVRLRDTIFGNESRISKISFLLSTFDDNVT